MKKRCIGFFLLLSPLLFAQDTRPVVAVLPFEAADLSANEKKTIENLVQTYISEMDDFRIVTPADRERALSEQEFSALMNDPAQQKTGQAGALVAAQFLLSGTVGTIGDDRILTLQVVKVKTGEKKSVSSIYRGMSDLALGVRALVLRAFEKNDSTATPSGEKQLAAALRWEDIVGTWRGDKGIELVRIFRGGKAVAVFSSGVQMELAYRIEGEVVRFAQISPNVPRFYHPVPYAIAMELVKTAQPMEWSFRMVEDGSALRGTKTATAVSYEDGKVREVTRDAKRDAEWVKMGR